MAFKITLEAAENAAEVADLHCAAFGGTTEATLKIVTRRMRQGKVFVARRRGQIIAMLCLTLKKPWAIDASYFTPVRVPLYLLSMAVAPPHQQKGIGRLCLREVEKIAHAWPAQAIRLDAFDTPAGAGGFYQRCGYREVGRVVYRQTPLIYYERLINPANHR
jgi:GNAT superfamily N-acetyltransferase